VELDIYYQSFHVSMSFLNQEGNVHPNKELAANHPNAQLKSYFKTCKPFYPFQPAANAANFKTRKKSETETTL